MKAESNRPIKINDIDVSVALLLYDTGKHEELLLRYPAAVCNQKLPVNKHYHADKLLILLKYSVTMSHLVKLSSMVATMLFISSKGFGFFVEFRGKPVADDHVDLELLLVFIVSTFDTALILLAIFAKAELSMGNTQSAIWVRPFRLRTVLYGEVITSSSKDGKTAVTILQCADRYSTTR